MPARTLKDLAQRQAIRGIRDISDVGEMPYEMIRPILTKLEIPEQLATLEQNCPQLIGADAEIWRDFIKRDIPNWETKPHEPSDPKNWCKVYRKLKRDADKEMLQGASKLKAALAQIKESKEQNVAQIVNRAYAPKPGRRAPTRNTGTNYGLPTSGWARKPAASKAASSAKMSVPTHKLKDNRTTKIMSAPSTFIEDQRRRSDNLRRQQSMNIPRTSGLVPDVGATPARSATTTSFTSARGTQQRPQNRYEPPHHQQTQPDLADREARLRALTSGRPVQQPSSSSSSLSRPHPTNTPQHTTPRPTSSSVLKRTLDSIDNPSSATASSSSPPQKRSRVGPNTTQPPPQRPRVTPNTSQPERRTGFW